jgi:hypothetical protein
VDLITKPSNVQNMKQEITRILQYCPNGWGAGSPQSASCVITTSLRTRPSGLKSSTFAGNDHCTKNKKRKTILRFP